MEMELKAEIIRVTKFNKLLFEKNMIRFAAYALWFFLFIFVWIIPVAGKLVVEGLILTGVLSAGIFALLYASILNGKHKHDYNTGILPVGTFFSVTKKAWIISKYIFMLRFLIGMVGMILIQGLFMCVLVGMVPYLWLALEVAGVFILVSGAFTLMMRINDGGY